MHTEDEDVFNEPLIQRCAFSLYSLNHIMYGFQLLSRLHDYLRSSNAEMLLYKRSDCSDAFNCIC